MSALDDSGFSASSIDPVLRRFYEQTSRWRMEVWAQWNPLLQPGGQSRFRTDHILTLGRVSAVRLHYKLSAQ